MLVQGDARHLPLRDASVQCVVTSPPYFGLRDYGTASWDGGDPACDHDQRRREKDTESKSATSAGQTRDSVAGNTHCRKCGARRIDRQIGLEETPDAYVTTLVNVFREVRRVLRDDGTLWLNLGDSYNGVGRGEKANRLQVAARVATQRTVHGLKPKDLIGIPWRVAFALQADGWWLRQDIIWHKPNPMPESVEDRCTKAHEYLFLLTKSARYLWDAEAMQEPATGMECGNTQPTKAARTGEAKHRTTGNLHKILPSETRNRRSVWTINTMPFAGAHFATMPEALVEPCILAGSRPGDLCCDPFIGSGTVGAVCNRLDRRWVGLDLAYQDISRKRTAQRGLRFT